MVENAIVVKNISKSFTTRAIAGESDKLFRKSKKFTQNVLNNLSFNIKKGEVFGIIGRNGSGKSTFLKIISKIMKPDSGTVDINGNLASILELGMGFHQDLSGRENIYLKGSMYGFTKGEIDERIDNIINYAELADYIDLPVRVYSSGMSSRLAFSIMINVDADIVVLDEVLSTGDLAFGMKSKAHFSNMKSEGKTIVLVTHSMSTIRDMCDRVAWIDQGRIREIGPPNVVCGRFEAELANSFEVVMELAKSGVPSSQNLLGRMYRDGDKVDADRDLAKYWFEEAANRDFDEAKINLADMLVADGLSENKDRVSMLYASAAQKGNKEARTKLSRILTVDYPDMGREVIEDFKKLLPSKNPHIYFDYADLLLKNRWGGEGLDEIIDSLEKSASCGNVYAMFQLSILYRDGGGITPSETKHMEWLTRAAEAGHTFAQLTLGNMYRDGIRLDSDESIAFKWYEKAAKNNNLDAIFQLATMYRDGKGVKANKAESDRWFKLYAEHGLFRHINILADSFSHGKNGVYNPVVGVKWYSENARRNHAESKYRLGVAKMAGKGCERNPAAALSLFKSALNQGHIESAVRIFDMYRSNLIEKNDFYETVQTLDSFVKDGNVLAANALGNLYANGDTRDPDAEKAAKYLSIAGTSISGAAQKLGVMYRDGIILNQDIEESIKWFERGIMLNNAGSAISIVNLYGAGYAGEENLKNAIDGLEKMSLTGNVFAMKTLGNFYLNGVSLEVDANKAKQYLEMASEFGDVHSAHLLGEAYRYGVAVEKDIQMALKWYELSSLRGYHASIMAIIELYGAGMCDDNVFSKALKRLESIAEGGNIVAMRSLGILYFEGKIVPKNVEKAKLLFEKGAKLGDYPSKNKLKSLQQ